VGFYFAGHKDLNFSNPESHKIFRQLVENIKTGIFMADTRNNIFYVNTAFAETFELRNCFDVLGKNLGDVCFSNHDQYAQFLSKLNTWGTVRDLELTHVAPGGGQDHLLVTAGHIYSDEGEEIGIHGFVVNVSNRHKLEEDLFLKHQKLEQVLGFCNSLDDIFQIEELTSHIVSQTAQILGAKRCSLMLVDAATNELYINASWGLSNDAAKKARVRIGEPVAGVIAMQEHAVLVEDIEDHNLFKCRNKKTYTQHSFMAAPIFYSKRLMGILNVSEKQGRFNEGDLKILETIAQQSALNINKTETLSAFEHLSQTDPLTGLLNYRSFVQKMEEEIYRAGRYDAPLSLMMIDLDKFKEYNDTQGHPEGDKLLIRLAEIFKANLRATELICRYGGDEFGIILPETDLAQAVIAAEKVREKVVKEFSKEGVFISIGVAQLQTGSTKDVLIKQADQALYRSKNAGRNRVSLHHPEPQP